MSHSTNHSESPGGLMSKVRTPVLFLLGLVLVLGAYYFLYAQKKTSYLVGRNFRLLTTMGNMAGEAITSYGEFVESQAEGGVLEVRGLTRIGCPVKEDKATALPRSESGPLFRLGGTGLELAYSNFCYKLTQQSFSRLSSIPREPSMGCSWRRRAAR